MRTFEHLDGWDTVIVDINMKRRRTQIVLFRFHACYLHCRVSLFRRTIFDSDGIQEGSTLAYESQLCELIDDVLIYLAL
jgi:hypothetical protein